MSQREKYILLDGVTSTTQAAGILVSDFDVAVIRVTAAATPNLTLEVMGAIGTGAEGYGRPDFTANSSPSNPWDLVEIVDLEDGTALDGDTGIVLSGTDPQDLVRQYEVNVNQLDWLAIRTTSHIAGTVTAVAILSMGGRGSRT